MSNMAASPVLWSPSADTMANCQMGRFKTWLQERGFGPFADYHALHQWSIEELELFWQHLWDYCGLIHEVPADRVLSGRDMPGAEWFPGMRMNFAANLLRLAEGEHADREAVVAYCETRPVLRKSYAQLKADVGALEAFFRTRGIVRGDRVAAVVTNGYEALVGMLAATSLGAIWSSASPDFGTGAILDRFGQIEPAALIVVNGYGYGGKVFARQEDFAGLIEGLPSLRCVVSVQQLPDQPALTGDRVTPWPVALAEGAGQAPSFTPLPPDHPVYILYSSGTTGKPKCIVHGAAGLLVNHAKELMLHGDVGPADRFLYFTTCGWMMWNWQASALLTGAAVITVDGSPGYPDLDMLWRLVADEKVTHFGTSARFLAGCRKAGLTPAKTLDLSALRVLFSTGSPLLPEDYDWVYADGAPRVLLGSIAGGTDICGCFVGATPLLPVRRGEIQCRFLGVDAVAYGEHGEPVSEGRGELVCRQPLPSMPVAFWGDPRGERYRAAYFETFPGVWAHGDFIHFTEHGGAVIHGRSDATLNPGGVRIGTAEIYRQVETEVSVKDSLVVGRQIDGDVEVVLLVVANDGGELSAELIQRLRTRIREGASPRHVPRHVISVPDIPYTRSGKKVELAVAGLLNGAARGDNRDALANPEALDRIRDRLRQANLLHG
ncbi:acetoacetate--CoA ligase [Alloalcanivorax xenomutans]|uniref:Acetoacetate--CoA ligase n=1 Tax=Alloalcanivorax xenomutans TaxID=1094342 RepID=A0A9Q3W5B0_9GAMM|nr:acetoacetate--CoA ligase [Alloalcanivorax xenomutans]MCE7509486.1 acetoacetate--CoA ligase [Alloalcanivorax xenomutans]MCE7523158.1 acetoacetate--CoA ligase [Alloalcanivorax xenomutans]WOA32147.1 acetoacetate--CoA ligase [Alloalcanivorax xenomutans]WOD29112.1 acetoacetate--CoA ligase [Alloalcanivorax xenomutans]CUR46844.1 Acetoacetyl-CoA synthetase [Alloalcanivorax xenomutans]